MNRRQYIISPISVNGVVVKALIIDRHLDKHSDHINDEFVKVLVNKLHGEVLEPIKMVDGFQYYASIIFEKGKWYKLIWLMEVGASYIGVITAFRDRRIK